MDVLLRVEWVRWLIAKFFQCFDNLRHVNVFSNKFPFCSIVKKKKQVMQVFDRKANILTIVTSKKSKYLVTAKYR